MKKVHHSLGNSAACTLAAHRLNAFSKKAIILFHCPLQAEDFLDFLSGFPVSIAMTKHSHHGFSQCSRICFRNDLAHTCDPNGFSHSGQISGYHRSAA